MKPRRYRKPTAREFYVMYIVYSVVGCIIALVVGLIIIRMLGS